MGSVKPKVWCKEAAGALSAVPTFPFLAGMFPPGTTVWPARLCLLLIPITLPCALGSSWDRAQPPLASCTHGRVTQDYKPNFPALLRSGKWSKFECPVPVRLRYRMQRLKMEKRNQNEENNFGVWSEAPLPKPAVHLKADTAPSWECTGGLLLLRIPSSSEHPPIAHTAGELESLPEPLEQQLYPQFQSQELFLMGTDPGHSKKHHLPWKTWSQHCSWLDQRAKTRSSVKGLWCQMELGQWGRKEGITTAPWFLQARGSGWSSTAGLCLLEETQIRPTQNLLSICIGPSQTQGSTKQ